MACTRKTWRDPGECCTATRGWLREPFPTRRQGGRRTAPVEQIRPAALHAAPVEQPLQPAEGTRSAPLLVNRIRTQPRTENARRTLAQRRADPGCDSSHTRVQDQEKPRRLRCRKEASRPSGQSGAERWPGLHNRRSKRRSAARFFPANAAGASFSDWCEAHFSLERCRGLCKAADPTAATSCASARLRSTLPAAPLLPLPGWDRFPGQYLF